MIKFFVEKENITGSFVYIDDKEDVKHLVKVLRAKTGDKIMISDKAEWEYETEIESISRDEVKLKIIDKQKMATEPETGVTLFQGIPKGSKMETIIQKCVELGVEAIVPVFMDRTVVADNGSFNKKIDRWQKISDEAVKQCKRGRIPEVSEAIGYDEMLREISRDGYTLVLLPYENEDGRTIKDALREYVCQTRRKSCSDVADTESYDENKSTVDKPLLKNMDTTDDMVDKVAIIIGPEGGFDDKEIEKAKNAFSRNEAEDSGESVKDNVDKNSAVVSQPKLEIVSLGKTILRTETAGLAALSMVMYELEL